MFHVSIYCTDEVEPLWNPSWRYSAFFLYCTCRTECIFARYWFKLHCTLSYFRWNKLRHKHDSMKTKKTDGECEETKEQFTMFSLPSETHYDKQQAVVKSTKTKCRCTHKLNIYTQEGAPTHTQPRLMTATTGPRALLWYRQVGLVPINNALGTEATGLGPHAALPGA